MGKTKIKTIEEEEVVREPGSQRAKEPTKESPGSLAQRAEGGRDSSNSNKPKKKRPGKSRGRGKKYREAVKLVDRTKKYPLEEAIKLAQQASYSKFEGALEAHINTSAKNIRGLVSLPHLSGKSLTVLAFGKGGKVAGADIEGTEETISEIEKGPSATLRVNPEKEVKLSDVNVIVVTPEWMPKLAKAAKILGPRGLMPNPKNGTITENLEKAVADLKGGRIEYKSESNGQVIHLSVGKTTQAPEEITANIKVLYTTIGKSKIKKITLSPTMGPGVKIDLRSI